MNPIFTDPAGAVSPDGSESGGVVVAPTMSDAVTVVPRLRHSTSGASRAIRFIQVPPCCRAASPPVLGRAELTARARSLSKCGWLRRGADDHGDDPLLALRARYLLAHLAAASHHYRPVGHLGHVIEGVRDDDDGVTLGAQAGDQV